MAEYFKCLKSAHDDSLQVFEQMEKIEFVEPYIHEHFGRHSFEAATLFKFKTLVYGLD